MNKKEALNKIVQLVKDYHIDIKEIASALKSDHSIGPTKEGIGFK